MGEAKVTLNKLLNTSKRFYLWEISILEYLKHPFLLSIRLYWGYQFFLSGYGKFGRIDNVTGFFTDLGIPAPRLNAYMASTTECVGGLFLLAGLASRLTSIPLIITMIVALVTAHLEETMQIFSKPDAFLSSAPFLFLFATLIILIFGPGALSIDGLVARKFQKAGVAVGEETGSTSRPV